MSYTKNQYQLRMKCNMSKLEVQALPKLSIDMACLLSSKERIYHLTQWSRYMWLPNAMDALWYLFDAMGFSACVTWTEKARQQQ